MGALLVSLAAIILASTQYSEVSAGQCANAATPLLLATQLGLGGVVERLLELKADLNAEMPGTKQVPVHVAAMVGELGVIRALIQASANLALPDAAGFTPLSLASHAGHPKAVQELACLNLSSASVQILLQELLEAAAMPEPPGEVPSPMVLAAGCGSYVMEGRAGPPAGMAAYCDIVKLLLDAKGDASTAAQEAAAVAGASAVLMELAQRGAAVQKAGRRAAGASARRNSASPGSSFHTALETRPEIHLEDMPPAMKSAMKSKAMKAAKAMTKSQLADQLATKSELKKKDVLSVLQNLSEIGASEVTTTGKFVLPGLCMIKTRQKPATKGGVRMMFGKEVQVKAQKAKTIVKATPVAALKNQAGPSGSSPLIAALRRAATPRLALKDQAREPPPEPVVGPQAEAARALLDLGASPLLSAADGTSALMLVAALDDQELLQRLLAAGAELDGVRGPSEALAVDWKTIDDLLMHMEGTSQPLPPSVLCPRGHPMERLCKARCHRRPHCDSCRKQELHSSPVYWTCWPCDYDLCIDCARVPRLVQFREGFDPLAEEASASLPEGTPEVLRSPFTIVSDRTALHHAVVAGSEKSVRQLLERKADPALADARGLTPLHWAAFLANGAIQPLIEHGAAVTALDHEGRPPLSLMPNEPQPRYVRRKELRVVGSGPADGVYSQVKPSQPQAAQSSSAAEPARQAASAPATASAAEGAEPSDPPPPPPPAPAEEAGEAAAMDGTGEAAGEAAEAAEATAGGVAVAAAVAAAAAAGDQPDEVVPVFSAVQCRNTCDLERADQIRSCMLAASKRVKLLGNHGRPRYQRTDGVPFLIKWDEKNGWALYQTAPGPAGVEACDTRYCPVDGWAPDERVQLEETPNVRVEEVAPYRWGVLLFQATPAELWRPGLQEEVEALPELKQITSVSRIFIPGLPGMQISLSAAGGVEGMHQRALEMVMRGMDEPSCPVATATAGAQAGAIAELDEIRASVQNLPAFLFLVNVRRATFLLSLFRWKDAGDAFSSSLPANMVRDAVEVYRSVGRRALCPSLSLNSHLCYTRAGCEERAAEMLALCRSYREEKKKWSPLDRMSLRQAEAAHRQAQATATSSAAGDEGGNLEAEPDEDEAGSDQSGQKRWRPMLLLYQKISCVYRGVNFMKPEAAQEFLQMVQEEAQKHEDADGRCIALCIQAEAMRQSEDWDEALRLAGEGVALQPELTTAGLKTGSLHFCHLVLAYSHYALGRPSLAQEALTKLSSLSVGDHFFQKQVEFKATHLRFLVGAEFEESYREISVAARSKERLVVEVQEGTSIQWDFILSNYTIDFVAMFTPATAKEGDAQELQRVEQHQGQTKTGASPGWSLRGNIRSADSWPLRARLFKHLQHVEGEDSSMPTAARWLSGSPGGWLSASSKTSELVLGPRSGSPETLDMVRATR
eukprot:s4415_g1.t3